MLKEGEVLIYEEGASHFQNYIAVGGKLKLTNMRVLFFSHENTSYQHEMVADLNEISGIEFFKTLLINPNGMALMMKNGDIENFIVDDRKAWSERIRACQLQVA